MSIKCIPPLTPLLCIEKLGFAGVYRNFLNFDSKHILWVLARTASVRRFKRVPTMYVLSENIKNHFVLPIKFAAFLLKKISVYCMGKFS